MYKKTALNYHVAEFYVTLWQNKSQKNGRLEFNAIFQCQSGIRSFM